MIPRVGFENMWSSSSLLLYILYSGLALRLAGRRGLWCEVGGRTALVGCEDWIL